MKIINSVLTIILLCFIMISCTVSTEKEPWKEEYDKIVKKYEPLLEKLEENSVEYGKKIEEFNQEILKWSQKWHREAMNLEPKVKKEVSEKLQMLKDKIEEMNKDEQE